MNTGNAQGRRLKLAFMPLSWGIAIFVMVGILKLLSLISGEGMITMLSRDDLWPLAVCIPGVLFGKVLGMMAVNCVAWLIPPLRRIFENECNETGRPGFRHSMSGLAKGASFLGALVVIGGTLFLFHI